MDQHKDETRYKAMRNRINTVKKLKSATVFCSYWVVGFISPLSLVNKPKINLTRSKATINDKSSILAKTG
jgi:hypothetical protein